MQSIISKNSVGGTPLRPVLRVLSSIATTLDANFSYNESASFGLLMCFLLTDDLIVTVAGDTCYVTAWRAAVS